MFTKTEIDLCRKVAEKWRKFSDEWGNYVYDEKNKEVVLIQRFIRVKGKFVIFEDPAGEKEDVRHKCFPLLSISDCLEWLRADGREYDVVVDCLQTAVIVKLYTPPPYQELVYKESAKTPLEALLRAVLAILEEG